jgi:CrcB protein
MSKWIALGVGGVLGAYLRYGAGVWVPTLAGGNFPYGTLVANLSACLILGFLDSLAQARGLLGPNARLLLMTGFCGAYSTFSTLVLESSNLAADGQTLAALINYLGSGVAGFLLLRAGMWLGTIV